MEPKPNPVADLELNTAVGLVVVLLHIILSLEEAFADFG